MGATIRAGGSGDRTAQFLWTHGNRQWRAHKSAELHFPVRVSDVGGGRCSFAVSATRRRQAWVLGFNVVLGLLCAVDCCQPHYAFLDVARDSVRPFVPRLCSLVWQAVRPRSSDPMHG